MKKKIIAGSVFMLIVVAIVFIAYAATPYKEERAVPDKSFTITELAKYDGKEGRRAYIAYNGIVYDLTDVKAWKNGEHKQGKKAGNDYTGVLDKVWHGPKVLKDKPVVGKLVK
ncbi:MAG TPA: cytochrome b5 domain-containing protein [bacterium]|nr:cytochrome b5 domain-containing protein [bacterium]